MQTATSIVPSPPQDRTDYGVGASGSAAAIGVSEYKRPIDEWLVQTGQAKPFDGNEKTRWGQVLEPVIRAHYVETNHVAVHVPPVSLFHRELPFIRATPDGIVLDERGKWLFVGPQVKNVGLRMAPKWDDGAGGHTTPIDYFIQGVVEMAVCDLPRIDFAVLLGGQEYFEVTIERDRELEGDVLEKLAAFWKLVEERRAPKLDDSDSYRAHLLRSIKRKVTVQASVEDVTTLERWREVVIAQKRLKNEERGLKNRIAASLATANANRLASDLGDVVVGAGRKTTGWKAVAEELSPSLHVLAMVEHELEAMRLDAAVDEGIVGHVLMQRIDALRAQVKLAGALKNYSEIVARHTAVGDPILNRPRNWTKDVGGADESEDSHD